MPPIRPVRPVTDTTPYTSSATPTSREPHVAAQNETPGSSSPPVIDQHQQTESSGDQDTNPDGTPVEDDEEQEDEEYAEWVSNNHDILERKQRDYRARTIAKARGQARPAASTAARPSLPVAVPCKKGRWSGDEAWRLYVLVQSKGKNWKDIGRRLGRESKSCRDKYGSFTKYLEAAIRGAH